VLSLVDQVVKKLVERWEAVLANGTHFGLGVIVLEPNCDLRRLFGVASESPTKRLDSMASATLKEVRRVHDGCRIMMERAARNLSRMDGKDPQPWFRDRRMWKVPTEAKEVFIVDDERVPPVEAFPWGVDVFRHTRTTGRESSPIASAGGSVFAGVLNSTLPRQYRLSAASLQAPS
jgi:hypothetical protein